METINNSSSPTTINQQDLTISVNREERVSASQERAIAQVRNLTKRREDINTTKNMMIPTFSQIATAKTTTIIKKKMNIQRNPIITIASILMIVHTDR